MIIIGFISIRGYSYGTINWPPVNLASTDHARLSAADSFRSKILMAVFGISGLLLIGLSVLVWKLF